MDVMSYTVFHRFMTFRVVYLHIRLFIYISDCLLNNLSYGTKDSKILILTCGLDHVFYD